MNHVPGEKLEEERPKMLATLISATRKRYIVRFVPCVALVGAGFLLESQNEKFNAIQKICKKLVAWPSQAYTRTKMNVEKLIFPWPPSPCDTQAS